MTVSAIVVAAGRGERFSSQTPKPLARIDDHPLIFYCLRTISRHPLIDDIVLVVNAKIKDRVAAIIKQYRIRKISHLVIGGRRRQDSVYKGLKALNKDTDLALIHDGARPFIDKETITAAVKEAVASGAAIVGVPVKATIKQVIGHRSQVIGSVIVKNTLDRDNLWEVQTPQVFQRDLIMQAYRKSGKREVTDDAALVERLGAKVRMVKGSYSNIKITTPEDLVLAQAILRANSVKL